MDGGTLGPWQQVVAGLREGVIVFAPDESLSYANAAALAMHGVASPEALGTTVAEYRANFVLHYRNHQGVGPLQHPIERALAGEALHEAVVEVRHARDPRQFWLHRIRTLVITEAGGAPAGHALLIEDVSERFEAEARFENMFRANPAPAVICRLADLRYVKVNQGFLDLTGYAREDVVGRAFTEVDVLREAERRTLALERLHAGRTIRQMEACLCVPADGEKHVIVAGHPIEMPGGERCMLFTFADLEDRCKAEQALMLSEERFAKAFQLSPVPTALLSEAELVPTSLNAAFATTFGDPGEQAAMGKALPSGLWVDEDAQRRFKRTLSREGRVRGFEARLRTRNGGEIEALVSAEQITIQGEVCVLCAVQDITARKRSEAELITAIEAVMGDASWFSRGVVEKLAHLRSPTRADVSPALVEALTLRERDMLAAICRGASDEETAAELGVALNTVRNHVASLYRKLGVNRRSAVIVWARERGLEANPPTPADRPFKLVSRD